MRVDLTDRFVKAAKSGGQPQLDYFDASTAGLALRVSAGGRKAWSFVFTSPRDGRRARVSLGAYPGMSLATARGRALQCRGFLGEQPPRDPRDVISAEIQGAQTVQGLIDNYVAKHVRPTRRSAPETERRFLKNVSPIIGAVRVGELHRRDINRVIDPILDRKSPIEATRTFEDLRAMLRWAARRGDLDRSPMEGMAKPAKSEARVRVLSDEEIRTLWNGLPVSLARSKSCQRILKLCLILLQRVGEISGMALAELELKKAQWIIPAARSKNGHAHLVHLPDLAIEIIEEAIEAAGKKAKHVFPNPEGDGPLLGAVVARTVARAHETSAEFPRGRIGIEHWTAHDLRRTGVSNMAKLGVAPIVLGHVINHRSVTKAGVTLSVYSQYDYGKEKKEALDLWTARLSGIIGGGASILQLKSTK
jgi:integrase